MGIRIPSSDFHRFTDGRNDSNTDLVVERGDELITLKTGSNTMFLTREQAGQLRECLSDWIEDRPESWSDFWTAALK